MASTSTAARQARIAPGRAQDWIVSVLNPIIDLTRREIDAAAAPWRWLPTSRSFEWFAPVREALSGRAIDNYEDFISKNASWQARFDEHDALFGKLGTAVGAAFDDMMSDAQMLARVRDALPGNGATSDDARWYVAALAAGFESLGPDHAVSKAFDATPALRTELAQRWRSEIAARDAAKAVLIACAKRLFDDLRAERTRLADSYGARIRPTED